MEVLSQAEMKIAPALESGRTKGERSKNDVKSFTLGTACREKHEYIVYRGNHPEAIKAALEQRGNFEEVGPAPAN